MGFIKWKKDIEDLTEQSGEPMNIWKVLLISIVLIGITVALGIGIYNSEWFINQTLHIKKAEDIKLGKHTTWSYVNKYEGNRLKLQLTIKNVDEKVMKVTENYFEEDDYLLNLIFEDKDGFKISELKIPKEDFVRINSEKGQYNIQTSLMFDKTSVRKIQHISPIYREILDIRYDDMMKEIDSRYRKAVNNLFGF